MEEHERVAQEIARVFFGGAKKKRQRAKPHRCFDCGKVTKHIFCPACSKRRGEQRREQT